jgi:hypothetical protein
MLFIDKEEIALIKNGHGTRKCPGHIVVFWGALVLTLFKEDLPKLYKNEFIIESKKMEF